MKSISYIIPLSILAMVIVGCSNQVPGPENLNTMDWKMQLNGIIPEFGHRNWILVVDKAFPAQNANGIKTINTGEDLLDVLSFTLQEIDHSTHVKPIIYNDKELGFITPDLVGNIEDYRSNLDNIIRKYEPQEILHDSVFVKIDEASKLFKILVLKTEEVIAYSSVFIQLDCGYWSAEKEDALREAIKE